MLITQNEINEFKLDYQMLGGIVRWRNVKRGGQFVCPTCKNVIATIDPKEDNQDYEGSAPQCESCGTVCKLKGATPTGMVLATIQFENGEKFGTIVRKNPKDKSNFGIFKQIMLGRLSHSINGKYNHSNSFCVPNCTNFYIPEKWVKKEKVDKK